MSGSRSQPEELLAVPAVVIAETIREHLAARPDIQAGNLAYTGGALVGVAGYTAVHFWPYASHFSGSYKLGLVATLVLGVILIVIGWRGRGGRKIGGGVRAILVPGLGFYLVATYWPDLLHLWWVQAFSSGIVVANVIRAAHRLAGGDSRAFDLVAADIARNEWQW